MRRKIEINIDKLVLHGFSHSDRHSIGNALEAELTRLFTGQDIPETLNRGFDLPKMDAESINISPLSGPEAIGTQAAKSIYKGFTK